MSKIKYISVCSGIEAASVAWHSLDWEPLAFSEIEPFPCAVLAHHWPHVPNHGDMTKFMEWPNLHEADLLVGGTPCQAFSVAGLRNSLSDDRGNLTLTYVKILNQIDEKRNHAGRPAAICVWENVPGVLNTKDNAFGCFLGALAGSGGALQPPDTERGWTNAGYVRGPQRAIAWRIFDAQYFGVAQRRRRVFVVASARDGFDPAAVLFERESLCGNPPPSRETREDAAVDVGGRSHWSGGAHPSLSQSHNTGGIGMSNQEIFSQQGAGLVSARMVAFGEYACEETASTMKMRDHKDATDLVVTTQYGEVAGSLTARHDSSPCADRGQNVICIAENIIGQQDHNGGNGKGFQEEIAYSENKPCSAKDLGYDNPHGEKKERNTVKTLRLLRQEIGEKTFTQWGLGILDSFQQEKILRENLHGKGFRFPTFTRCWMVCCALGSPFSSSEGAMQSVWEACDGCSSQRRKLSEQLCAELGAYLSKLSQPGAQKEGFMQDLWQSCEGIGILREALSAIQKMGRPNACEEKPTHSHYQVRRLTPSECEFLQGFPKNHTLITWRGKPAPDGPRYKACGNSMAVPCMKWIGERIQSTINQQPTTKPTTKPTL